MLACLRCVRFQSQSAASQAEKRQRSFDKVVDEWKRKVADLQAELEASQRDSRTHAAEVYKLRAQLEEAQDGAESLRRETKSLSGLLAVLVTRTCDTLTSISHVFNYIIQQ